MIGWRRIETAKTDGTRYLLWARGEQVTGWYEEGYTHGWVDHRGHHINPTCWCPLPDDPEPAHTPT